MIMKFLILIFLNVLIDKSIGENENQFVSKALLREEMQAWKTEMKKTFTDKIEMEINKLKETLEKRFEQISVGKLEENLEKKLEGKLEETLRQRLEGEFEKKQNKSQTEEWIITSLLDAISLSGRAVIAGYEPDGTPLWIARGTYSLPGKLNAKEPSAHFASLSKENDYYYYQNVANSSTWELCAPPERVRWVECRNGVVPPNAVIGGRPTSGETLYIGRAREQGSLTPGWVNPSEKVLSIVFNTTKVTHDIYEVLCLV